MAAAPKEPERGPFGQVYRQFAGGRKAKEAILFLKKIQGGEAPDALYHSKLGFIDLVWGENDPKTNIGHGLKHIIEKHGEEIKQLGFTVENFIPIALMAGNLEPHEKKDRVYIKGDNFMSIIKLEWDGKSKRFLLTAFDMRASNKKPLKNGR